jgi:Flp pilus assembly protein TadD
LTFPKIGANERKKSNGSRGLFHEGNKGEKAKALSYHFIIWAFLLGTLLLPHSGWCLSEEGQILLARGNYLYLHGKFAEARVDLQRAAEMDPQDPEVRSLLGLVDLQLKEYARARDDFDAAVKTDPNDPRAKLYLGVSYFFLGNYQEAERWMKQAQTLDPNDPLVKYYLGLLAERANRDQGSQEARTEMTHGVTLGPEAEYGAQQDLARSRGAMGRAAGGGDRKFYVSFTTGSEYDDNVKVLPDNSLINPGVQNHQYGGHKSDWRTPIILQAGYQPIKGDNWAAGVRYYGYTGINYRLRAFNVFDQMGEVYVKYRWKALTVEPFYAFEYSWLGGQPYAMYNDAGVRLTLQESKRLSGDLVYMFQYRDDKGYKLNQTGSAYNQTGPVNQVGFFQTLNFDRGAARAGFIWEHHDTTGINYAGDRYRFPVELNYQLFWQISAYLFFEYNHFAAINRDSLARKYRADDFFQVVAQLRRPVTSWMSVVLNYNHISNPSNVVDYQYNRNIYSILAQVYY